jgi:hypothetical protein
MLEVELPPPKQILCRFLRMTGLLMKKEPNTLGNTPSYSVPLTLVIVTDLLKDIKGHHLK